MIERAPAKWLADRKIVRAFEDELDEIVQEVVLGLAESLGRLPSEAELVEAVLNFPWESELEKPLLAAYQSTAPEIVGAAGTQTWTSSGYSGSFDVKNPYTQRFLEDHGAEMVTAISSQSRRALRNTLAQSYRDGLTLRRRVDLIENVVGLDRRSAKALSSMERKLVESGAKDVPGRLEKRRKKLLRRRAENIARTESVTAYNQGLLDSFRTAEDQGFLPIQPQKQWIAWGGTPNKRLCRICAGLHLKKAPLRGVFRSSANGRAYERPPAHPSCRCTMGLVFPTEGG